MDLYIYLARIFSDKISLLYNGRKQTFQVLQKNNLSIHNCIWFHCASLGEFEQGRPLIEKIKREFPDLPIVLSFFSPSGYEIRKHYDRVEYVFYLPSDTKAHMQKLIDALKPSMVFFVKYEFWWNLIGLLQERGIPHYLISGIFRRDQYFWYSIFQNWQNRIKKFDKIFVQDDNSKLILESQNIHNSISVGDTRVDRVLQNIKSGVVSEAIINYCQDRQVIVYGSVWSHDMPLIQAVISAYPDMVHIIAPHDISNTNIQTISKTIPCKYTLYSDDQWDASVLIIDNMGKLSSLYQLGKLAYVGGGFGVGIHNILEPAVYTIPVLFGPNHSKAKEAIELTTLGAAYSVHNSGEMIQIIENLLESENRYQNITMLLESYFDRNKGATKAIFNEVFSKQMV